MLFYFFGVSKPHFIFDLLSDLDGSDLQDVCLGWSMHLLAHKASSAAKSLLGARKGSSNSFRLAMYEGSPRALFSLSKPAAGNEIRTLIN